MVVTAGQQMAEQANANNNKQVFGSILFNVMAYGAKGDGKNDDTKSIQSALDAAGRTSGGTVFFPPGNYIISIAKSVNPNSCLVIPSNITFQGSGMGVTTFTRPASERGTDGLLFVNKGWDTASGYNASGNIKFFDFTISDGAAAPYRGSGDLIALGHAHDILIQRVESLNHDQHFVDICGSRYVTIRDCVNSNDVDNPACAIYQIDQAINGAVRGINGDGTSATNITIENCQLKKSLADQMIQIHNACIATDIIIHGNTINGEYQTGTSKNLFIKDATASMVNCKIKNNFFSANSILTRMINIISVDGTTIKDLEISGNTFSGIARIGIYVGASVYGSTYGDYTGIDVHDNQFRFDWRGVTSNARAISLVFCKDAKAYDNDIQFLMAGFPGTDVNVILCSDNQNLEVYNNTIKALDNNANTILPYVGIYLAYTNTIALGLFGTHKIRNNQITGVGFYYGIMQDCNTTTPANYIRGLISGNYVYDSSPSKAHYYESLQGSCDGTNNIAFVDFGAAGVAGNTKILALTTSQFTQNIPLPFKKSRPTIASPNGNLNPCTFKWERFFSQVLISNFAGDLEEMQSAYLSATTFAGTQIVDVVVDETTTPATSKFSILTGVSGITVVINNATFQPAIRTTGYLMIRVGV